MRHVFLVIAFSIVWSACATSAANEEGQDAMLPKGLQRKEISQQNVKDALGRVPRARFVPEAQREHALDDRALDIGFGQTISQPFVVALMTELAEVRPGSRVLEIGTGSGYQAAVLAELGAEVYSIEIIPELSERARRTLYDLGYQNVELRVGDGGRGWPEHAPFDAILVTAASPVIPGDLIKQLGPQGRMIIPLEEKDSDYEQLVLVSRDGETVTTKRLGAVRFVPLTGALRSAAEEKSNPAPTAEEPEFLQEALEPQTEAVPQSSLPRGQTQKKNEG